MIGRFDSILGTIGRAPVVRIKKLAPQGVNVFVKVEAFNLLPAEMATRAVMWQLAAFRTRATQYPSEAGS